MQALSLALFLVALSTGCAFGHTPQGRSAGQVLYLPIYPHVWHG